MKKLTHIKSLCIILMSGFILTACQKDLPATNEPLANSVASDRTQVLPDASRVNVTTVCFAAIARLPITCNGGEDILFGGKIEIRENVTVSGNGTTHITRHFTAKDMTGISIAKGGTLTSSGTITQDCNNRTVTPAPSPTAKTFTVVGGAEMFSIHYGPGSAPTPASANVFIHQGTLVFVNNANNNDRVVARHTIISTPGGQSINQWTCGGNN